MKVEPRDVSIWLAENVDSHTIYDPTLLGTLPDGVRCVTRKDAVVIEAEGYDRQVQLMLVTLGGQAKMMAADPRGGDMVPGYDPDALSFVGYWLSAALAELFLGESPGASMIGRGSAFRADVAGLMRVEPEVTVKA